MLKIYWAQAMFLMLHFRITNVKFAIENVYILVD